MGLRSIFIATVFLSAVAFDCRSQAVPSPSPPTVNESDLIHTGDIVDVDFVGSSDLDWRGAVAPTGELSTFVTYTGVINARCSTEANVAEQIAGAYAKILRDPKVVVKIVDRSGRAPITVTGAVLRPTRYQPRRRVRLREVIIRSGGFTDDASGGITILRRSDLNCGEHSASNGLDRITIAVGELLAGTTDPEMLSGDIVEVDRSQPVYVIGAVNNPRPVVSRADLTLSRAIASAGGTAREGQKGKATIFRREGPETTVIEVDLAKIKVGESSDTVLKPFDIIDVAGPAAPKRKFPPVAPDTGQAPADTRQLPLRIID